MIRILHVVTHMNRGGLETMIMNYYREIDRSLIQFDFLTHRFYDGDYGNEIQKLGGTIYHLPALNPFSRRYKIELEEFFLNHPEYTIIHVHQDCMSSVILKVAEKAGVRVRIAHSHSSSQDKNLKYPIKLFFRKSISKYATDLLACGKEAGEWMFCGAEYQLLNNAIDASKYLFDENKRNDLRRYMGISLNTLVVGHVGRFSPPKNHLFLIDIFQAVHEKYPDSMLLLVGNNEGAIGDAVKEKVKVYKLEKNVVFTGVRSDVDDLMQIMDVFVFPSIYEGFPVTMVEAQASGLPCFVSEKVPLECKMTEQVWQISLSENADAWALRIIKSAKHKRPNNLQAIKNAGFDIKENANWLQNYYLSKV